MQIARFSFWRIEEKKMHPPNTQVTNNIALGKPFIVRFHIPNNNNQNIQTGKLILQWSHDQ